MPLFDALLFLGRTRPSPCALGREQGATEGLGGPSWPKKEGSRSSSQNPKLLNLNPLKAYGLFDLPWGFGKSRRKALPRSPRAIGEELLSISKLG